MASDSFSMVHGFDVSSTLRLALNDFLGLIVPLHVYTDSMSLYDCLTKTNRTTEKRLLVDLFMLRQSYERSEIRDGFWIPTAQNPAYAFTKANSGSTLRDAIDTNLICIMPNFWVERLKPTWA